MAQTYNKALVTGGAGFIGSHLCEALLAEGLEVMVLDNFLTGKRENLPAGVGLVEGDIRDPTAVKKALAGVDIVFHQAAVVSVRSSVERFFDDAEQNIMGTLNLLQCLPKTGIRKFMFASSMAVYGEPPPGHAVTEDDPLRPLSPYGVSKMAAEKYCWVLCRLLGVDCFALRYCNTYGVRQRYTPYVGVIPIFVTRLLQGKPPVIFGDGEQSRDFVCVRDIVQANLLAMNSENPSGIYTVGSGLSRSVNEIAEMLVEKVAPGTQVTHGASRDEEVGKFAADISAISRELGYRPKGHLDSEIEAVIEEIRATL